MTSNDIVKALITLRPGAQWNLRGDDLSGIEWLDQIQTRPTDDEIITCVNNIAYKDLRRMEYPDPAYLFDALVHKENGDSTQYNDYIAKCNAVKDKYPKSS